MTQADPWGLTEPVPLEMLPAAPPPIEAVEPIPVPEVRDLGCDRKALAEFVRITMQWRGVRQ